MRILLVDDSRMARAVLRRVLERLGYGPVEEAEDGKQALDRIERERFDLVVADWHMPHLDGLGLLEELRRSEAPDLPVLIVSCEPAQTGTSEALQAGARGYVRKPIHPPQLRARIAEAVRPRELTLPDETDAALAGELSEVGFPELIQFLAACRMSGRLRIRSDQVQAAVDLRQGEIRAAHCGSLFGDDAIFAIAELESGSFRFEHATAPVQGNVSMQTLPLLLEAMKQRDERTALLDDS